jgi:hypothetical protein
VVVRCGEALTALVERESQISVVELTFVTTKPERLRDAEPRCDPKPTSHPTSARASLDNAGSHWHGHTWVLLHLPDKPPGRHTKTAPTFSSTLACLPGAPHVRSTQYKESRLLSTPTNLQKNNTCLLSYFITLYQLRKARIRTHSPSRWANRLLFCRSMQSDIFGGDSIGHCGKKFICACVHYECLATQYNTCVLQTSQCEMPGQCVHCQRLPPHACAMLDNNDLLWCVYWP